MIESTESLKKAFLSGATMRYISLKLTFKTENEIFFPLNPNTLSVAN